MSLTTPPAPFMRRVFSMVYESLLVTAVSLVALLLSVPFTYVFPTTSLMPQVISGLVLCLAWGTYFGISWYKTGQTLPMKVWRIRLVDHRDQLLSKPHIVIRLAWMLTFMVGIPAIAYLAARNKGLPSKTAFYLATFWWILTWGYALFNRDRQFLHDKLAGTRQILIEKTPRK